MSNTNPLPRPGLPVRLFSLWCNCRGASYVEYLILIGILALGLLGAMRGFDRSISRTAAAEARAIVTLSWNGTAPPSVTGPPFLGQPGVGERQPDISSRPADEQKKSCSGFWDCAWERASEGPTAWWGYETGLFGAAWDDVSGTVTDTKDFVVALFTDPKSIVTGAVDTAKYVFHHPGETLKSLVWDEQSSEAWKRGEYAKAIGRTVWNVGSWAIPGVGEAKVATKLGKLLRLARKAESKIPDLPGHGRGDVPNCSGNACNNPGGPCFAAGTPVHTQSGLRAIETMTPGELVWSRDDQTGEIALRRVARVFVTTNQAVLELTVAYPDQTFERVDVTARHPFWTPGGWVAAKDLRPGDAVELRSGDKVSVRSSEPLAQHVTVYNFEVESFHTYFVGSGGMWVHNDCGDKHGDDSKPPRDEPGAEHDPNDPPPNSTEASTTRVDEDNPAAGTPEHKAQRWREYQERGGQWDYERWSKTYENNMERANKAAQAANAYRDRLGWGTREVTVDVEGVPRRLDIADRETQRAVEVKTGEQYATQENLWEIERDRILKEQGWDIKWHFQGQVSKPLKDALDAAGIPYDIEP